MYKEYREKIKSEKSLKKERELKTKSISDQDILHHIEMVKYKGVGYLRRRIISGEGRWMIPAPSFYKGKRYIKNRYIYEHRFIMEKKIGRLLNKNEIVHHINGNKLDNRIENLKVMDKHTHYLKHIKNKTYINLVCDYCRKIFKRELRQYKKNNRHNFCCLSHSNLFHKK